MDCTHQNWKLFPIVLCVWSNINILMTKSRINNNKKMCCEIIEKGNKCRVNDKLCVCIACGQVVRFRLVLHKIKISKYTAFWAFLIRKQNTRFQFQCELNIWSIIITFGCCCWNHRFKYRYDMWNKFQDLLVSNVDCYSQLSRNFLLDMWNANKWSIPSHTSSDHTIKYRIWNWNLIAIMIIIQYSYSIRMKCIEMYTGLWLSFKLHTIVDNHTHTHTSYTAWRVVNKKW